MTTQDDLIHDAVANHIGECEFFVLTCNTHNSYRGNGEYCHVMDGALGAADEAVLAMLADLREKAEALPIVEPQYPAIHDAVDRDDMLRLFDTSEPMGLDDSNLVSWHKEQEAQWDRERGQR